MGEELDRIMRRLAATADQTKAAQKALSRKMAKPPVPTAQKLSEGYLPPTYRNHYAWLCEHKPEEAKAFWDKWVVLPKASNRRRV